MSLCHIVHSSILWYSKLRETVKATAWSYGFQLLPNHEYITENIKGMYKSQGVNCGKTNSLDTNQGILDGGCVKLIAQPELQEKSESETGSFGYFPLRPKCRLCILKWPNLFLFDSQTCMHKIYVMKRYKDQHFTHNRNTLIGIYIHLSWGGFDGTLGADLILLWVSNILTLSTLQVIIPPAS